MSDTEEKEKTDQYDELLGFAAITPDNWLSPDRKSYPIFSASKQQWIGMFLEPRLSSDVPIEIHRLFELARAAMIYSWFFHPLATLGLEQCTRIAECAVWKRCQMLQKADDNFSENLKTLFSAKIIRNEDEKRWKSIRHLRNFRSHPKEFMLTDPGQAAGYLENTVELINSLFRT